MRAEIISIGDEILIGQISNTNSVWIARQLNLAGIRVVHMATVADDMNAIIAAFTAALDRADFVFITGGLGPTNDDLTILALAAFFNVPLVTDPGTLKDVEDFFTKRGRAFTVLNRKQAEVPEGSFVIRNLYGTAPGTWNQKHNTVFISMPGVPAEMKAMMRDIILPKIKSEYTLPHIYHKTVLTQGIGESILAELLEQWENNLASKNITLAYLPSPGIVRLRLSSYGNEPELLKKNVEEESDRLKTLIPKYIYGYENYGEEMPTLEKIVSGILRERGQTLSIAESCTGGYVSSLFAMLPGASEVFRGAVVPYNNSVKHSLLHVDSEIFDTAGAVSKECVEALAKNVREMFSSDYALSISGIAGPTGGTEEKPVGTVWIAVANTEKTLAQKFRFGEHRQENIVMTANAAINFLRKFIL